MDIHNLKKTVDALALVLGDLPPNLYAGRFLQFCFKDDGKALRCINRYLGECGPCLTHAGLMVRYPALWVISMVTVYGLRIDDLVDEKIELVSEDKEYVVW